MPITRDRLSWQRAHTHTRRRAHRQHGLVVIQRSTSTTAEQNAKQKNDDDNFQANNGRHVDYALGHTRKELIACMESKSNRSFGKMCISRHTIPSGPWLKATVSTAHSVRNDTIGMPCHFSWTLVNASPRMRLGRYKRYTHPGAVTQSRTSHKTLSATKCFVRDVITAAYRSLSRRSPPVCTVRTHTQRQHNGD